MRTFVAAVEAGSFTAAAERLGYTNKLVSKYVAALERVLGVRLLHRTTRALGLTDAGERYYTRCVALLRQLDDLENDISKEIGHARGTLRVTAPIAFGEIYGAGLLQKFQAEHPDLTVDLRLNDRFVNLADDGFDMAIRIGSMRSSGLIARRLATTQLWAFASTEYLEKAGRPQSPSDLGTHRCLHDPNLRSGSAWPFTVDGTLQGTQIRSVFAVNSAQAVASLAKGGGGIGLCPDFVVEPKIEAGRLERILLPFPSASLDISAVFLDTRMMPAKVRLFLDFLVGRFRGRSGWAGLISD